ncbi:hypothetical protein FEM55_22055 [Dyadobacter sediminis]|uniref:DUF6734 domain-containing protein n=2 Tax=Dyadobacter sediminis TaxID=1493691 RepID=A0A5R9K6L8_9BACT|nr:hypothetical protein FEM55_22055 [Dyadobacter sediminis]
MSWALSASLLHDHFGSVTLHTDLAGKTVLVDLLELPYSRINITQEGLGDIYPKNWWVMRKMYSYSCADGPFVHVDGDAFLWNGLSDHLRQKPLIAQNSQNGFQCYQIAAEQLKEAGIPMPYFLNEGLEQYNAVNMGVIGGTDWLFFKNFFYEIKDYYEAHLSQRTFAAGTTGFLNTMIEECFFQHYAQHHEKKVDTWISAPLTQGYETIANSMDNRHGFTHMIGTNKKDIYFCKQVEFQLKRRYPAVFRRVVAMIERFPNNSRKLFNFPQIDPFTESNVAISRIEPDLQVTIENCNAIHDTFKNNNAGLSSIIHFEISKYRSFLKLLNNTRNLDRHQQERLSLIDELLKSPVSERLDDLICFKEHIPLTRFTYPSKNVPYHLATIYDFAFEYRHIAHRLLDNLAIFILVSADQPISLASLIRLLGAKKGMQIDEQVNAQLQQRTDLKIKELIFLGLLDYLPVTKALTAEHEKAVSF